MALGKGLESLIPKKAYTDDFRHLKTGESVFNIEVEKITPNPDQPRRNMIEAELEDLAQSIREHGILQPLIVTKREVITDRGSEVQYQIIAGERRWRAAQLAGLPHVPVIIRGVTKIQNLELALVENIQRQNLNILEEARAYVELRDRFGLKQKEIAQKVGKSREGIANAMRVLQLPEVVQQMILDGGITFGHAKVLLTAPAEHREKLADKVAKSGISVAELYNEVNKILGKFEEGKEEEKEYEIAASKKMDPRLKEIEGKLSEILGLKVSIKSAGDKGKIIIQFTNQPELSTILERLGNQLA